MPACHTMGVHSAEFMASGCTQLDGHELVEAEVGKLLSEMRPQAVALVDGFALPDLCVLLLALRPRGAPLTRTAEQPPQQCSWTVQRRRVQVHAGLCQPRT